MRATNYTLPVILVQTTRTKGGRGWWLFVSDAVSDFGFVFVVVVSNISSSIFFRGITVIISPLSFLLPECYHSLFSPETFFFLFGLFLFVVLFSLPFSETSFLLVFFFSFFSVDPFFFFESLISLSLFSFNYSSVYLAFFLSCVLVSRLWHLIAHLFNKCRSSYQNQNRDISFF